MGDGDDSHAMRPKQTDDHTLAIEARLLLAQEFGEAYPFEWNAQTGVVLASPAFKALFGIAPHQPITSELIHSRIHRDDRARASASQADLLAKPQRYEDEFRIVLPDGSIRWILARGRSMTDAQGQVIGLAGVNLDITDRKQNELALQEREIEFRESEQRFRALADTMPQMVWSALPDGYHDYYNARWYEFTGVPAGSTDGEGWNGMFHPEDQPVAREKWRHCLATGDAYEIEYRLRHHSGEYRWTLGRALPIRDDTGKIIRWFGTCTDIHDAKRDAEHTQLLSHELSHRIKNIFAVIQGLVGLSARRYPEAKPFAADLQDRISALGRAHDFARPHGPDSKPLIGETTLHALIRALLEPYPALEEGRIVLVGEDISIDDQSATPLGLIFHEMATNASKYGALSVANGRVIIESGCVNDMCHIIWREEGGPPIDGPPDNVGFGTRLATVSVENNLNGQLDRAWNEGGLEMTMQCPVANLRRAVSRS